MLLDKVLAQTDLKPEIRKRATGLRNSLHENDNDILMIGKLKSKLLVITYKLSSYEVRLYRIVFGIVFLAAWAAKSSSPDMVDDERFLPTEETFKDIDLANNLKDCGKPLLLSDIVKDVEYVKLETQDSILVGDIKQPKRTEKFVFIYSRNQNHVMMFDTSGKFIRKIGRVGQGPGER